MHPLLLATLLLAGVTAAYLVAGFRLNRMRRWCPSCRSKPLKLTNYLKCNPPPNLNFFTCEGCGGQFVQVDRFDGVEHPLTPRAGSPWEHSSRWERSI